MVGAWRRKRTTSRPPTISRSWYLSKPAGRARPGGGRQVVFRGRGYPRANAAFAGQPGGFVCAGAAVWPRTRPRRPGGFVSRRRARTARPRSFKPGPGLLPLEMAWRRIPLRPINGFPLAAERGDVEGGAGNATSLVDSLTATQLLEGVKRATEFRKAATRPRRCL